MIYMIGLTLLCFGDQWDKFENHNLHSQTTAYCYPYAQKRHPVASMLELLYGQSFVNLMYDLSCTFVTATF